MRAFRSASVAVVVAGLLYLMLDSGAVAREKAPAVTSLSLGGIAVLFGVGGWAMKVGGQPERTPLLLGLAIGVGGYALLRLVL